MFQTLRQRTIGTTLMAGWTLAGLFLASRLPLLGAVLMALAGLPAFLVGFAWGGVWFVIYGFLTLGLTGWFNGTGAAVLLIPLVMIPAGVLASLLKARLLPMRALGLTLLLATLISTALWGVLPLLGEGGTQLWGIKNHLVAQKEVFAGQIREFQKQNGTDSQSAELLLEHTKVWIDFLILLVPVTFIFAWHLISLGVFYAGGVLMASRLGLGLGLAVEPLPSFPTWRFGWNLIWLFVGGWLMFYGADMFEPASIQDLFRSIGANCLAISKILYFIVGLSIVFFYFDTYKISPPNRIGLSFLALLLTNLLVWLGIIDVWADFRAPKLRRPRNPAATGTTTRTHSSNKPIRRSNNANTLDQRYRPRWQKGRLPEGYRRLRPKFSFSPQLGCSLYPRIPKESQAGRGFLETQGIEGKGSRQTDG